MNLLLLNFDDKVELSLLEFGYKVVRMVPSFLSCPREIVFIWFCLSLYSPIWEIIRTIGICISMGVVTCLCKSEINFTLVHVTLGLEMMVESFLSL